ncbi:hypothetical protein BDD12DRAFT_907889 [Trichophaea hybrida]|nr:hypothetical protein BDD12DRAFT_907889 [Trichophaea hybrida]
MPQGWDAVIKKSLDIQEFDLTDQESSLMQKRALAQLSGGRLTPVAFSFGWVTYAISALLAAVGENKLIPVPDSPGIVINARSRYSRQNNSWILGRIIRDFNFWKDKGVAEAEREFLAARQPSVAGDGPQQKQQPRVALCVAVYEADFSKTAGVVEHDWVWYSGLVCAVFQLGVSTIPWGLWGDWSIFLVTGCGIMLSLASGSFPQWKAEKWACRRDSTKTAVLTRGNGWKDAIVIIGAGVGLDLEDLSGGREVDIPHTRFWASIMAALWVALLICVSGLHDHTWFLLAIGVTGMAQNIVVCGAPRNPSAFGIHLNFKEAIVEDKVMEVLKATEEKYPYVGRSLVDVFFPSGLREDEEEYWKEAGKRAKAAEDSAKRGEK